MLVFRVYAFLFSPCRLLAPSIIYEGFGEEAYTVMILPMLPKFKTQPFSPNNPPANRFFVKHTPKDTLTWIFSTISASDNSANGLTGGREPALLISSVTTACRSFNDSSCRVNSSSSGDLEASAMSGRNI